MNSENLGPCVLEGGSVRLEPLRRRHLEKLAVALGKLDWGWSLRPLRTKKDVEERIKRALKMERKNEEYIFAVILKEENRAVGSTAYFGIEPVHKRAEIGYTWYEQRLWGTTINPECKLLLLQHAFEDWHANRIQLSTDIKNVHSQNAILKLGAKYEGTLRNHAVRLDGSIRDTMMYSITSTDWPMIKTALQARIAQRSET